MVRQAIARAERDLEARAKGNLCIKCGKATTETERTADGQYPLHSKCRLA